MVRGFPFGGSCGVLEFAEMRGLCDTPRSGFCSSFRHFIARCGFVAIRRHGVVGPKPEGMWRSVGVMEVSAPRFMKSKLSESGSCGEST